MGGLRFALLCATVRLAIIVCVKINTDPTIMDRLKPGLLSHPVENSIDICMISASSCNGIFRLSFFFFFSPFNHSYLIIFKHHGYFLLLSYLIHTCTKSTIDCISTVGCGWCEEIGVCLSGSNSAPNKRKCNSWHFAQCGMS